MSIPAADYRHYHQVRIGALPTWVRTGRGSTVDKSCRACAELAETPAHVVQMCLRTHGGRVLRHDAVVELLAARLRNKGWIVEKEHLYQLDSEALKPDLVAVRPEGACVIIDAQVVSAAQGLRGAFRAKVRKYERADLLEAVGARHLVNPEAVEVVACTISWRGVWCCSSVEEQRDSRASKVESYPEDKAMALLRSCSGRGAQ
ncbi:hypothetical protein GE061_001318 [Apolygus lucorum]|uniref:Reverse transcriptase zinc-binding domain-containing protein n=1 Tax=Apolygus lucorum TaxID=248454 RepID=A0A6A4ISC1_APOLU|nr:hypothetical protein GE061_001318 [Apolygus lucorum]